MTEKGTLPSPLQGEGKRRETVVAGGVERARRLRREMTLAERVLWKQLRKLGMNFRRQAPIGRYIVDFMHHESRLIVEVDGPVHDEPEVAARDLQRTAWLQSQGYRVIRFAEKEVRENLFVVTERIATEAFPPPSPTLPPSRGKGEPRYLVR
ncbi:MAG: endonuclease domain-containing protein [Ignavibacteriales bacterium]